MKARSLFTCALFYFLMFFCLCSKEPEQNAFIVQSLHVDKTDLTMHVGEREILSAKTLPTAAVPPEITWVSDAPEVASVSRKGEVEALAVGKATLTATCQSKNASVKVTVLPAEEVHDDAIYTITLKGEECRFADFAEYGIFLPSGFEILNGILVLQHGCGMEQFGITRNQDLQYQAFAKKWGILVIETALHGPCEVWHHPESGSAAALVRVIAKVASKYNHPELNNVPWLLFGHSSGGHWVLGMLRDYPERILAAVCYSAAWDPQWDYSSAAAEVPVLLRHAGADDAPTAFCEATAVHTFAKLRKMDAPAAIAYNKGQHHNLSYIRHMAIPYYGAVMKQRLPEDGSDKMRPLDPSQCWLGNPETFEIVKESDFGGDKSSLCVLPDRETAEIWKEYVTTNDVKDKTPPPEPYGLEAARSGKNVVELKWKADADIESGIASFKIFVDEMHRGTLPESGWYQSFDTNGDNAYPVNPPPMRVTIKNAPEGKFKVGVRTVNQAGLESETAEIKVEKY